MQGVGKICDFRLQSPFKKVILLYLSQKRYEICPLLLCNALIESQGGGSILFGSDDLE